MLMLVQKYWIICVRRILEGTKREEHVMNVHMQYVTLNRWLCHNACDLYLRDTLPILYLSACLLTLHREIKVAPL